ncbi:hypothetical protein G6F56_007417 [Rhizopus delemar]|nr:hypothetical protein G6F56_007417 [Rhizopus delemar]
MGYCTHCNQNVYSNSACPKCHQSLSSDGSSRITSIFASRKGLGNNNTVDKWQDTYSRKGIFSNRPTASSSTPRPRQSVQRSAMPNFPTEKKDPKESGPLKSCAYCHKKQHSWSDFNHFTIYKSVYYCKPCLEEKLTCPKCQIKVKLLDPQIDFSNHIWHTPCFQCHHCSSPLKEALAEQDSDGNPSCRSCHVTQKQPPSPKNSSVSTPLLTSSKSALTSAYFISKGRRPLSVLVNDAIENEPSTKPDEPKTPIPADIKKTHRRKKIIKRPCKECEQHVSKKDYRGLKTITGDILCYHSFCLSCEKCHQPFDDLKYRTDGKAFYHTKCPENTRVSPQSEEEEPFPQTPTTLPQVDFNVLSSSPTPFNLLPTKEEEKIPTKITELTCNTCSKPVTDTFLELANHFYHKECLLCAGCEKTVPTNRKLSKYQDKLYCDSCSLKNNTDTLNNDLKNALNSVTKPSDIFKSRTKNLPRLGGVRTCARCSESMPILDTHPGPNATRWHKKCLRCSGCNKQMDSDAHMTMNESSGLCLVHCRECLDDTPKPKFVR